MPPKSATRTFRIVLEGHVDSDGDGNPDITAHIEAFGFSLTPKEGLTQNVAAAKAFAVIPQFIGQVRSLLGIG